MESPVMSKESSLRTYSAQVKLRDCHKLSGLEIEERHRGCLAEVLLEIPTGLLVLVNGCNSTGQMSDLDEQSSLLEAEVETWDRLLGKVRHLRIAGQDRLEGSAEGSHFEALDHWQMQDG